MNIVTSICVDILSHPTKKKSTYPQIKGAQNPRIIYWRCVVTFCITALKYHPEKNLIVYTNDNDVILIDGYDVKEKLESLGVQIIQMPFISFDPKDRSKYFRNAFYKLEVIEALGKLKEASILLDSDCIWTRRDIDLFKMIESGSKIVLKDTYQRSTTPELKEPHNLSMKEMGDLYKGFKIKDLTMQVSFPVWYGGEIVGATPALFLEISKRLKTTFDYCIMKSDNGKSITFNNGSSIFDGDELISSFVYNTFPSSMIYDSYNIHVKRIWNGIAHNNVNDSDLRLSIWHLPAAKQSGLKKLFKEIKNPKSKYHEVREDDSQYLGSFFGIPSNNLPNIQKLERYFKVLVRKIIPKS